MRNLNLVNMIILLFIAGALFDSCREDDLIVPGDETGTNQQTPELKSAVSTELLTGLIEEIEDLVSEAVLSAGSGQALISKIENAIKSLQSGNLKAMKGQLKAFINQVESLVRTGRLTPEQGEALINGAESQIIVSEGSFTDDRDGHEYKVVLIGSQIWMAENLAYLPLITPSNMFSLEENTYYIQGYTGTTIDEARTSENFQNYGVLYNWKAALISCPEGWHLPSAGEWELLAEFISNDNGGYDHTPNPSGAGNDWKKVGMHLKSVQGWKSYWDPGSQSNLDGNGTDDYGFCGLPGGMIDEANGFRHLGELGWWWTSTENWPMNSWHRNLVNAVSGFYLGGTTKSDGLSVRCIKN